MKIINENCLIDAIHFFKIYFFSKIQAFNFLPVSTKYALKDMADSIKHHQQEMIVIFLCLPAVSEDQRIYISYHMIKVIVYCAIKMRN